MSGKLFHAVVKLMVAQDDRVISQRVHQCIFHLAAVEREKQCALHSITRMDEHGVGVGGAQLVIDGPAPCHATLAVTGGVNLAMGVIYSDNHQVLGTQGGNHHERTHAHEQEVANLCHNLISCLFFVYF